MLKKEDVDDDADNDDRTSASRQKQYGVRSPLTANKN